MTLTAEEMDKKFEELPQDVKTAIYSVDFSEKIAFVGKKNNLHIDQVGELGETVRFVMIGIIPPTEFVSDLVRMMKLPQGQAEAVAKDVQDYIMLPIRESLKKIHQDREAVVVQKVNKDINPTAHDILAAISNPESVSTVSVGIDANMPADGQAGEYANDTNGKYVAPTENKVPDTPPIPVPVKISPSSPPYSRSPYINFNPDGINDFSSTVPVDGDANIRMIRLPASGGNDANREEVRPQIPSTQPTPSTPPAVSMAQRKLSEPMRSPAITTSTVQKTQTPLIPEDHKARIDDPYRESV